MGERILVDWKLVKEWLGICLAVALKGAAIVM